MGADRVVAAARAGWARVGLSAQAPAREIVDAILYQARTGCSWRQLPGDLPPWSTVYDYFAAWSAEGTKRPQAPIMVAEVSGRVLTVALAPSDTGDPSRCRPSGSLTQTSPMSSRPSPGVFEQMPGFAGRSRTASRRRGDRRRAAPARLRITTAYEQLPGCPSSQPRCSGRTAPTDLRAFTDDLGRRPGRANHSG